MDTRRDWYVGAALASLLAAWLPASAAGQPLLYVASDATSLSLVRTPRLTIVNSATGHVVKTMDFGPVTADPTAPWAPAVVAPPDGTRAYVTSGRDLIVVNAANYTTERITFGGPLGELAITADGSRLYIASNSENTIVVLDTATLHSGLPIALPGPPRQLELTADGSRLYVLGDDTVYVADTVARRVVGTLATSPSAVQLLVHPDGSRLFVGNATGTTQSGDGNSITAYDTSTLLEIETTIFADFRVQAGSILVPARIGSMAILPAGDRLYVPLVNAGFRTSPTAFFRAELVHVVDSLSLDVISSLKPLQTQPTTNSGIAAVVAR